ncbi:MAG: hypothetical protein EBW87_00980 [Burkholderiaceae bacterium]|nr:hypothetical protein [Burkholderiaceae bacterium]
MPTTTNNGWTTPADTDLVRNGAAAIRTAINGIDTTIGKVAFQSFSPTIIRTPPNGSQMAGFMTTAQMTCTHALSRFQAPKLSFISSRRHREQIHNRSWLKHSPQPPNP